ncbi:MAG: hypothetical protein HUU55_07705 [Myxococcales bacterium]|nr:hypothetical protein [Myxococcales bacterium]
MVNLPESTEWPNGIYQLETTDPVLGGPGGSANLQATQLASRTAILRTQTAAVSAGLAAATRDCVLTDDNGYFHAMVWIPRFRIPALYFGAWPSEAVTLGGFFIDKYVCSHHSATFNDMGIAVGGAVGVGDVPVSQLARVPWTNVTVANAMYASTRRRFNGEISQMASAKEWATVALLGLMLGGTRGNNDGGKDHRHDDAPEFYGLPDPNVSGRILPGTGPLSYSHNGRQDGVCDLIGNLPELVDAPIQDCRYTHILWAVLTDAGGISSGDTAMTITQPQDIDHWPATNGRVKILSDGTNPTEVILYGSLVDSGGGVWTLTGCTRAQEGTTAEPHDDGSMCQLLTDFCVLPGGATTTLQATINDSATSLTINTWLSGPGTAGVVNGSKIAIESEVLLVTNVAGSVLTVTRAQNGTSAAAHDAGKGVVLLDPDAAWASGQQGGYITELRDEPMLRSLAFPAAWSVDHADPYRDYVAIELTGLRACWRGGSAADGNRAETGLRLQWISTPTNTGYGTGFRAVLRVNQIA